ncbi:hypothetical protein K488DRAFT_69281 [Vararia minispora EC-137]|uniref:Uncharacterized protein n=1 Tax=Vararia minispora EC-137 TaxID=1314806 RepID=A0ACB8QR95_9AGAM|nr:hypothetical protein K488DRAFT_69281 [Vararia minispora EC-137]
MPHPPVARRRDSRNSDTPRTPSLGSPIASAFFFPSSTHRKSSDSWNSAVDDDDFELEWKPDQILLLTRTLDAIPSHMLTPYTGAVPPSNLLDKIARGVAQVKGPKEWPHSLRATRAKLVELARGRDVPATIDEEGVAPPTGLRDTTNINTPRRKRPLYRQSSMDFMAAAHLAGQEDSFTKVSSLLQASERVFPTPSHHHPLSPSTPSSATLRSATSSSSTRYSRPTSQSSARSLSALSSASSYSCLPPAPRGLSRRSPLKRASSYSVQAVRRCSVSEDEEEAARSVSAKKQKRVVPGTPERRTRPTATRRNPLILGGELPVVQSPVDPPRTPTTGRRTRLGNLNNPHPHLRIQIPPPDAVSPHRSLRRTARRISFNTDASVDSLPDPTELLGGNVLGSAFELA